MSLPVQCWQTKQAGSQAAKQPGHAHGSLVASGPRGSHLKFTDTPAAMAPVYVAGKTAIQAFDFDTQRLGQMAHGAFLSFVVSLFQSLWRSLFCDPSPWFCGIVCWCQWHPPHCLGPSHRLSLATRVQSATLLALSVWRLAAFQMSCGQVTGHWFTVHSHW